MTKAGHDEFSMAHVDVFRFGRDGEVLGSKRRLLPPILPYPNDHCCGPNHTIARNLQFGWRSASSIGFSRWMLPTLLARVVIVSVGHGDVFGSHITPKDNTRWNQGLLLNPNNHDPSRQEQPTTQRRNSQSPRSRWDAV